MTGPMTNPLDAEEFIRRRRALGLNPDGSPNAGAPAANMDASPDVVNAMAGNRNAAVLSEPTPPAQEPGFWGRLGAAFSGRSTGAPSAAPTGAPSVEQAQRNFETYQTDASRDALQQAQQSQEAAELQRRQQLGASLLKSGSASFGTLSDRRAKTNIRANTAELARTYAALGGTPRRPR
jgi:hypothetical protein